MAACKNCAWYDLLCWLGVGCEPATTGVQTKGTGANLTPAQASKPSTTNIPTDVAQQNMSCGFLDFACYQRSGPSNLGSTGQCPTDPVACITAISKNCIPMIPIPCWIIILIAVVIILALVLRKT